MKFCMQKKSVCKSFYREPKKLFACRLFKTHVQITAAAIDEGRDFRTGQGNKLKPANIFVDEYIS